MNHLRTTSLPLIASSMAGIGWPKRPAVAPSMPRRSRNGSGSIILVVRIILGVALLGVAGVLMGVHLWSKLRAYPPPVGWRR